MYPEITISNRNPILKAFSILLEFSLRAPTLLSSVKKRSSLKQKNVETDNRYTFAINIILEKSLRDFIIILLKLN